MAAWTYADWITQGTASSQRDRLRLHIAEVSAEIGPNINTGASGRQNAHLIDYLKHLQSQLSALESATVSSGGTRAPFTRGRPL